MSPRVVDTPDAGKGAPFHVSWGALFAGAAAALGVWILLYALGVALGLSTVDPKDSDTLRATGIFTGIFGLAAPLVALFVGGLVAGRSAGSLGRGGGALHGLVVWSLTALGGLWLVVNIFGAALGSAVAVGKNVASQAITEKSGAAATAPADGVVGDVQQAIGRVQRGAASNIRRDAMEAAPETSTAFWVVFGALFLGALAAISGGALGVTRAQRHVAEADVIAGTAVAAGAPASVVMAAAPLGEPEVVGQLRSEIAELRSELRQMQH
jgi:hypothetical protein